MLLSSSDTWDAPQCGNPIIPGYFADPSLVQHGGRFYLYATIDPWGGDTLGCWESADFKDWTYRILNWPTKAACSTSESGPAMVWAPSVVEGADAKFYMYVSVGSEVWAGVAEHPLGPWRDLLGGGKPLIPKGWNPAYHMIDAEVFIDDDGSAYLYWGSGLNWVNGRCFAVKLRPDMTTFDGDAVDVTPANYFEAPLMVKHDGKYFLMYSNGITVEETYRVHYAVGDSPLGPFTEPVNSPILFTGQTPDVVSPGHHTVFRHEGQAYILYHRHSVPFVKGEVLRQLCVDRLEFTADGVIAPVVPTHRGPELVFGRGTGFAAVATASSEADCLHAPARVLEENHATRWSPVPESQGAWLRIDMLAVKSVHRQYLKFEYAWKRYHFLVEASADGEQWVTLADYRVQGAMGSPVVIEVEIKARYLRLIFPAEAKGSSVSVFAWKVE